MINVARFKPSHYAKINLRGCHAMEKIDGSSISNAVTVLNGLKPIAIFGGSFIADGVFYVWGMVSDDVCQVKVGFFKAVKSLISNYTKRLGIRRMQMAVRCDYEMGYRFAHALGFQDEGIMRGYSDDGSSCFLMARVS